MILSNRIPNKMTWECICMLWVECEWFVITGLCQAKTCLKSYDKKKKKKKKKERKKKKKRKEKEKNSYDIDLIGI